MLADMMSGLLGGGGGSNTAPKPQGTEWFGYRVWPDPAILTVSEQPVDGTQAAEQGDEEDLDLD